MTAHLVPTVRTKPTPDAFAKALRQAAPSLSKEAAGVVWAQFALETGYGEHCYGWNLGNIKHVDGDGRNWHALRGVWEIVNGQRVELAATNPGSWFRSFDSLEEGMGDHIEFLQAKRYASVWSVLEAGDPVAFAHALKLKKYYTASEASYAAGLKSIHASFMKSATWDEPWPAVIHAAAPVMAAWEATEATGEWLVPVELNGETWLVCPIYIAPVGIGEAEELAAKLGFELPTPELVDAIWRAADLKINGWAMAQKNDGTPATMSSQEAYDKASSTLASLVGNRSLGQEFHLLAGAFKDVVKRDGKVGLYGWHDTNGKPIQGFFTGHAAAWKDYSQGLRLVRRA